MNKATTDIKLVLIFKWHQAVTATKQQRWRKGVGWGMQPRLVGWGRHQRCIKPASE